MAHFSDCFDDTAFSAMTLTQKRKRSVPRTKTASASSSPALPPALTPPPAAAPPLPPTPPLVSAPTGKRKLTRRPVRIGDALRQSGLDEWKIADGYISVVDNLTSSSGEKENPNKLLVDVLKECSRLLEPARSGDSAGDGPVTVRLVHRVSRPRRTKV
jgi:hypothetical protein